METVIFSVTTPPKNPVLKVVPKLTRNFNGRSVENLQKSDSSKYGVKFEKEFLG